jgi:hypothetical protein
MIEWKFYFGEAKHAYQTRIKSSHFIASAALIFAS